MDEDCLPDGWMVIDVDEDESDDGTCAQLDDESELGGTWQSQSDVAYACPSGCDDVGTNLVSEAGEPLSRNGQETRLPGEGTTQVSYNISSEEPPAEVTSDKPQPSKKACRILGIEVDEPAVDSERYWSEETIATLSCKLMNDSPSSSSGPRLESGPASSADARQEEPEVLPEVVTKLVADLAGVEAVSDELTEMKAIEDEANRVWQSGQSDFSPAVPDPASTENGDDGACSDILAEVAALCSQGEKESAEVAMEMTQVKSASAVEQPVEPDGVLAIEQSKPAESKLASKSGALPTGQTGDEETVAGNTTSELKVRMDPKTDIVPSERADSNSERQVGDAAAAASEPMDLQSDPGSQNPGNLSCASEREPTSSEAMVISKSDIAANTRKRLSGDDNCDTKSKKGKYDEDVQCEDKRAETMTNPKSTMATSEASVKKEKNQNHSSNLPQKRKLDGMGAAEGAEKFAKVSCKSKKQVDSTRQPRRTSAEKTKDSPRKRLKREMSHLPVDSTPAKPVRKMSELIAQSQHLWELDMYQLTMKNMAESSIKELISMSLMSHWTQGKSTSAQMRTGKLSLMYGSTKLMKRAVRAACMYKSSPEAAAFRPFLLRRECPPVQPQPLMKVEGSSGQALAAGQSGAESGWTPSTVTAGNLKAAPEVQKEMEEKKEVEEKQLLVPSTCGQESKEPVAEAEGSPAATDRVGLASDTPADQGKMVASSCAGSGEVPPGDAGCVQGAKVKTVPMSAGDAARTGEPSGGSTVKAEGASPVASTEQSEQEQEQKADVEPTASPSPPVKLEAAASESTAAPTNGQLVVKTEIPSPEKPASELNASEMNEVRKMKEEKVKEENSEVETSAGTPTDQVDASAASLLEPESMEVGMLYPAEASYSPEEKEVNESWNLLFQILQPQTLEQFLESQMNDAVSTERYLSVHGLRCVKEQVQGHQKMKISIPKCYVPSVLAWAHALDKADIKEHRSPKEMLSLISSKFSLQVNLSEMNTFVEKCVCSLKSVQTLVDILGSHCSLKEFTSAQRTDSGFKDILSKLMSRDEIEKNLGGDSKRSAFTEEGGILLRVFRSGKVKPFKSVLVPADFRNRVLQWAHISGDKHLPKRESISRLVTLFHWPDILKSVEDYIKMCEGCQKMGQKPSDKGISSGRNSSTSVTTTAAAGAGAGVVAASDGACVGSSTSSAPVTEADPWQRICKNFNQSPTGCFTRGCILLHVCINCGGKHRPERCKQTAVSSEGSSGAGLPSENKGAKSSSSSGSGSEKTSDSKSLTSVAVSATAAPACTMKAGDSVVAKAGGRTASTNNGKTTAGKSASSSAAPNKATPSKAVPPKATPSKATPSQAAPSKATPGKATPSKATPSQAAPSKATPREAAPTKTTASKATPSQATPSKATPGKATPSKATPSQAAPTKATAGKATPSQAAPSKATPSKATPSQAAPSQAAPSKATPSKATPSQAAPTKATPSKATPSQAAPTKATPSKATPSQAAPTKATASKATPSQAAPSKATPSKATPSKATPSQAAPSKATPSKATPSKATPSQAAPTKATPSKATPSQATPTKATPSQAAPSKATPSKATPSQAAPSKAVPNRAEPTAAAPSKNAPSKAGPSKDAVSQATASQATASQASASKVAASKVTMPSKSAASKTVAAKQQTPPAAPGISSGRNSSTSVATSAAAGAVAASDSACVGSSTSSPPVTEADPWQRICKNFNQSPTGCFTRGCILLHVCINCGGKHRPERCKQAVSDSRPSGGQPAPGQSCPQSSDKSQAPAGEMSAKDPGATAPAKESSKSSDGPKASAVLQCMHFEPVSACSKCQSAEQVSTGAETAEEAMETSSASVPDSTPSDGQPAPGQGTLQSSDKSQSPAGETSQTPAKDTSATAPTEESSKSSDGPKAPPEQQCMHFEPVSACSKCQSAEQVSTGTETAAEAMETSSASDGACVWGKDAVCDDFNTEGGCQKKCGMLHVCSRCMDCHPLPRCSAQHLQCSTPFLVSFKCKWDADLVSVEEVSDPKVEFGSLTAQEIQPSTIIMANLPTNLRKEVQAEILQVLFPYACGVKIAWPPKGHNGCIGLVRFASSTVAQAVLRSIGSLVIGGSSINLRRGVLKKTKTANSAPSTAQKSSASGGASSDLPSRLQTGEKPQNISIVRTGGLQTGEKQKNISIVQTGGSVKGMQKKRKGGKAFPPPAGPQFGPAPVGGQQMFQPPANPFLPPHSQPGMSVPPYSAPMSEGGPPPYPSVSLPYQPHPPQPYLGPPGMYQGPPTSGFP